MNDDFAAEKLLYLPASEGSLPHITPAMIVDCLADSCIISKPKNTRRVFRWFIPVSQNSTACTTPASIADASLLFICSSHNALQLLEERTSAFALIQLEEGDDAERFSNLAERCIIIPKTDRTSHLALFIQSYFIKILLWESDLKNIALRDGDFADLLDASVPVLRNFIFISDNNFNVIGRTNLVDPPDELHRNIIERGCLTPSTIAEKRFRLPEKVFYTREPSSICPFSRISFPVHINHSYYGSISMACDTLPDTEGLRDLFHTLIKAAQPICEKRWRANATLNLPSYFFFVKLLEHEEMTDAYLSAQLEMARLPEQGHFKLILMEVDESVDPDKAILVSRATSGINDGKTVCFPYQNQLVCFCYTDEGDGELAHAVTLKDLDERIYRPFGVECGVSSIFKRITDLDLAFRQARIALGLRDPIKRELFVGEGESDTGIYLFEEAMLYYLVDPFGKDERFLRYIFSVSIPNILHSEDLENGTNHVALLWFWIKYERNATAVSKRLHMHRNTVLYHIEKIEKRFNFNMDKKPARDWLLMSFKYFFLTQSDASLATIFAE